MLNIHEILPAHDLIYGLLLPLAIAIVVYAAALISLKKGKASAWAAPLATGVGFAVACAGISGGLPALPPAETVGWLCYTGATLAVVGIIFSILQPPVVARIAVALLASLAIIYVVTLRARANGVWTPSQAALWIIALTLATTVLMTCIDILTARLSPALATFLLAIIVAALANVFGMTGSASLAKETGAVALTLLPAWIIALLAPRLPLREMSIALGPLLGGVMLTHHLYSYSEGSSPVAPILILAAIPALLCLTGMPWMMRRPRWQIVLFNLIVTIIPSIIAVTMVAIPFMKSMREGQTEGM
jgi:hypothetical protein